MTTTEAGYDTPHCVCGLDLHISWEREDDTPIFDAPRRWITVTVAQCAAGCTPYLLHRAGRVRRARQQAELF